MMMMMTTGRRLARCVKNITLFTKTKALIAVTLEQARPRPHVTCVDNFVKFRRVVIETCGANGQTHRHADRIILRTTVAGEVTTRPL